VGPTSDGPSPGHLATRDVRVPARMLLGWPGQPAVPTSGEEACRLVGGGRSKWAAWRRWPRQAGSAGAAVENATRRSQEVIEVSRFLEAIEVDQ
jgi:hypothetical protein